MCSLPTWVSLAMRRRMSGTPSPVMAEVGTSDTVWARSSFFQYSSELSAWKEVRSTGMDGGIDRGCQSACGGGLFSLVYILNVWWVGGWVGRDVLPVQLRVERLGFR